MLYVIADCVQCDNMAREGLRTLVVAKKTLTEEQYADFEVPLKICIFVNTFVQQFGCQNLPTFKNLLSM